MKNKILIVDDEKVLIDAIVDKFIREEYEVLTANNGQEGLKVALEQHPDLILLDIIMPVMDGITMLSELRKDQWGQKAKVIMLTNLSDPGDKCGKICENTNGYFVKSDWKLVDIFKQVKQNLSK